MFMDLAQRHFADTAGPLLIISSAPLAFSNFLSGVSAVGCFIGPEPIPNLNATKTNRSRDNLRDAYSCWGMHKINRTHDLINRIKPLFPETEPFWCLPSMVMVPMSGHGLAGTCSTTSVSFSIMTMPIEEVAFVSAGIVPWIALHGMQHALLVGPKKLALVIAGEVLSSAS